MTHTPHLMRFQDYGCRLESGCWNGNVHAPPGAVPRIGRRVPHGCCSKILDPTSLHLAKTWISTPCTSIVDLRQADRITSPCKSFMESEQGTKNPASAQSICLPCRYFQPDQINWPCLVQKIREAPLLNSGNASKTSTAPARSLAILPAW